MSLVRVSTIDKAQLGSSGRNQRTVSKHVYTLITMGRLLPLVPDTGMYRTAVKKLQI